MTPTVPGFRILPGRTVRRLAASLLVAVALAIGDVHAGELCDDLRQTLLEQSTDRTVVQLKWPDSDAPPGPATLVVAVPGPTTPEVTVLARRDLAPLPSGTTSAALPASALQVDPPRRFRRQWLVTLTVDPWQRHDERITRVGDITLEISHPYEPAVPRTLDDLPAQEPQAAYAGVCINEQVAGVFRADALAARAKVARAPATDTFAWGENWLRIEITQTGIHAITFDDLVDALLSRARAESIVPGSLRLLSARGPGQPRLPEDDDGSWRPDHALIERSLRIETDGPLLAAGDRILFYAAGPEEWTDRHDPRAPWFEHFEHEYADRLAYWLTWEEAGQAPSGFPAPPRRMPEVDGTVTTSAAVVRAQHRARVHAEENRVELHGAVADNWVWERRIEVGVPRSFAFPVRDLAEGSLNTFHTHGTGRSRTSELIAVGMQIAFNDDPVTASYRWQFSDQRNVLEAPLELDASGFELREGDNTLVVENVSDLDAGGLAHEIIFDFFDVTYQSRLVAHGGAATWVVFADEVDVSQNWEFQLDSSAPWSGTPYVLDTTSPGDPRIVMGASVQPQSLRFEAPLTAGVNHHFCVVDEGALRRPDRLTVRRPRLLRAEVSGETGDLGYDLVVLHPSSMAQAAEELVAHRTARLDGHPAPRVEAVELQDVYDQFGHGVKEPAAIRNYLKFLFTVDPRLEFVALLGDASRDARNRAGRDEQGPEIDRCPTYVQTHWPLDPRSSGSVPYAFDDWFVSFENPPPVTGNTINIDLPDLAIGRLPAGSPSEAVQLVRRVIDYESSPAGGAWRNRAVLVADDEFAAIRPFVLEREHVEETECITDFLLPAQIDVHKLYLTEFPRIPGATAKPRAREALRQLWSEGALIVHYVGHGSPEQMADEAVFRIEDVPALENGNQLPLFLALSCDVAIFDSPVSKSMTEQLLLAPAGGAIAGIAATQVTFSTPNENLTEAFYPLLYPPTRAGPSAPVGRALALAKSAVPQLNSTFTRHNDAKYVLLGDPALSLQSPWRSVTLSGDLAQSIRSAQVQDLQGQIESDGQPFTNAAGRYHLEAKESADSTRFVVERPGQTTFVLPYVLPGSTYFAGTGTFEGGSVRAEALAPAALRFGSAGRVRLLLESGTDMYVGLAAPLPVVREAYDRDDDEGPVLELSFENDARRVTPGSVLIGRLSDPSGINVLGSSPANSIQLEFDDDGFPVDVTTLFRLDDGTFTAGSLRYEIPATLPAGTHRVELRASDMLDNLSSATLTFSVISEGGLQIASHAVFPNPFSETARFVIEITAAEAAAVDVDIYTTDGRLIRSLRGEFDRGGAEVISWDGRDTRGDVIANGVYLYVVRAKFATDPPIREQATGRIVRMR